MTELLPKTGTYRYRIPALVFLATTINYFDRSIVGVMAPTLQKMFEWTNKDYAAIMVSFKIAYGIGLLFMGSIIGKMAGVGVAIAADLVLGAVLDTANNSGYFRAFVIAGFSYLIVLIFVHLLMPKMTPLNDNLNYIQ